MKLNGAQTRAVDIKDGPAMVIAGPGSGKTAVITNRVARLISAHGIKPDNILVLTFTRAAAAQMKERASKISSDVSDKVTFGTFHSIFYRILRSETDIDMSNILSQEQKEKLLCRIGTLIKREYDEESVEELSRLISLIRRSGTEEYHFPSQTVEEEELRFIYQVYRGYVRKFGLFDYDDMADKTKELFVREPKRLEKWRKKYRYILVDEFQDIDRSQYELISILAYPANNIFAVGDDDQSIYDFRGADPSIMAQFLSDYPNAKRIVLDINYRSTPEIIMASDCVIRHNKNRQQKQMKASHPSGERPKILRFRDNIAENEGIARHIGEYAGRGEAYDSIAVLARTRRQLRSVRRTLEEGHIPCSERGEADGKGVCLTTMHGAKGLEFDTVFIINANKGIHPYLRSDRRKDQEEERRLFYVAMTRAKKRLIISFSEKLWNKKAERSEYVDEIIFGYEN